MLLSAIVFTILTFNILLNVLFPVHRLSSNNVPTVPAKFDNSVDIFVIEEFICDTLSYISITDVFNFDMLVDIFVMDEFISDTILYISITDVFNFDTLTDTFVIDAFI